MSEQALSASFKVLQISDCHLHASRAGKVLGMPTRDSLEAVITLMCRDHPDADLVVVSGDLAQDGSADAYRQLREALSACNCPVVWMMGNHDHADEFNRQAHAAGALHTHWQLGNWLLVFLDSSVPGRVYGHLSTTELDGLSALLQAHPQQQVLVFLHHHPVPMGSLWLDALGLKNAPELFARLAAHQHVEAVIWGHVHQAFSAHLGSMQLLSTPSTCVQFLPGSEQFALDPQAPGYRWFRLDDSGAFTTQTVRVMDFPVTLDLHSDGY